MLALNHSEQKVPYLPTLGVHLAFRSPVLFLKMAKRSDHDEGESDEETSSSSKKQKVEDMALVTLPGSLELTASGEVRDRTVKNILQSPTVLLTGHSEAIYSIAFDPTGTHLASASLDRSISKYR